MHSTQLIFGRIALLAVVTLACAGAPREPLLGGGLPYNPFYEGRADESRAFQLGTVVPQPATPTSPALAPTQEQPEVTTTAEPAPELTATPSALSYFDLVAQILPLPEEQRPAFWDTLIGQPVEGWEGTVQGIEFGAERPVVLINLAAPADGSPDVPDARVTVAPELLSGVNAGDRVRFSGLIRGARSESGTDLLLEIEGTRLEKAP